MPWLGYFFKIECSDSFVFLDDVQIELASQQAYVNRVKTYAGSRVDWLTCPISRSESGSKQIKEVVFNSHRHWRKKMKKTLYFGYKKSPYFEETYLFVERLLDFETENLAEYNIHHIMALCEWLGIHATFARSSELAVECAGRSSRLVEICRLLGANRYLSGKGGMKYHETEAFAELGIEIVELKFVHPTYPQSQGEFCPGLSIVDALFNCGKEATGEFLRTGKGRGAGG